MVSHRCKKCMWFDRQHKSLKRCDRQHKSLADTAANLGYCRKHKPVIFTHEQRYYGGWPLVDEDDFCGEFREDIVEA